MDDIEETDDLRENDYLNDGFDDVDCDVDDLLKTKGRILTGSLAPDVDEDMKTSKTAKDFDIQSQNDAEVVEEALLDYSDFFSNDKSSKEGVAVMQLKSVQVMKQNSQDEDYESNIFPLPQSERRANATPPINDAFRLSRSSNHEKKRIVSPIVNPKPVIKMSKALSKKITANSQKKNKDQQNLSEQPLPSIVAKPKKKMKRRSREEHILEEKSVSSSKDAAREDKLPHIHESKNKVVPFRLKRNKDEIARAKERYTKAKHERIALGEEHEFQRAGRKMVEPVSPRINFKYDARLGLFGFDIEAERQSKRENYELMRIAKKNEEIALLGQARARVVHGAGIMDAKTIMPAEFAELKQRSHDHHHPPSDQRKPKSKVGKHARGGQKMRSKSDFIADPNVEIDMRSISSDNKNHKAKGNNKKQVQNAHFGEDDGSYHAINNSDAMQCSPVNASEMQSRLSGIRRSPMVTPSARKHRDNNDYTDDDNNSDTRKSRNDDDDNDDDDDDVLLAVEDSGPSNSKPKVRVSPLKLSSIIKKRQAQDEGYVEAPSPTPLHAKPSPPTIGQKKDAFRRKAAVQKSTNGDSSSPSTSPRKRAKSTTKTSKSPRKSGQKQSNHDNHINGSKSSPGKPKQKTKFDVDEDSVAESSSKAEPPSSKYQSPGILVKKTIKPPKKSIADELFDEFEALNIGSSPSPADKPKKSAPSSSISSDKKTKEKQQSNSNSSPRKGSKKGSSDIVEGPSGNASHSPKKPLAGVVINSSPAVHDEVPGSVDTSSSSVNSKKQGSSSLFSSPVKKKTDVRGKKVADDNCPDDDEEAYDEDFDESVGGGGVDDDILFDFKSPSSPSSASDKEKEKREQEKVAAAETKKQQKEKEKVAMLKKAKEEDDEKTRLKLEKEKNIALAKEEKRKEKALAKAKSDEEGRVALAEKRKLQEDEKAASVARAREEVERKAKEMKDKAAQAAEEARLKREEAQAVRDKAAEERVRLDREEKEAAELAATVKREKEEEDCRAAQAKVDEAKRLKEIELVKEEKLEKASKALQQVSQEEHANAMPKTNTKEPVHNHDDGYEDDYSFDEEPHEHSDLHGGDVETSEQDTSADVMFSLPSHQTSPVKTTTASSSNFELDGGQEHKSDDDEDVLFDFKRSNPEVVERVSAVNRADDNQEGDGVSVDEDVHEEESGVVSDYDDDFD